MVQRTQAGDWDYYGNAVERTYPDGSRYRMGYDALSRLARWSKAAGVAADVVLDRAEPGAGRGDLPARLINQN